MRQAGPTESQLARVPLFAHLSPRELRRVNDVLTVAEVSAGQVLTRQGDHGNQFFIVLEGTATVQRDGALIAEVGPGDFQGEISLLDGGERTATVTAATPMRIAVTTRSEFRTLLAEHPSIALDLLPTLASRVRALSQDTLSH